MTTALLIVLTLFNCFWIVLHFKQISAIIRLEKKVSQIDKIQGDQNIGIIKLMYHTSISIEDYETTKKIKDTMGKECDFNKFM